MKKLFLMVITMLVLVIASSAQSLGSYKDEITEYSKHDFSREGFEYYMSYIEGGKIYYFVNNSGYIYQIQLVIWKESTYDTFMSNVLYGDYEYDLVKHDEQQKVYVSTDAAIKVTILIDGPKWYIYVEPYNGEF